MSRGTRGGPSLLPQGLSQGEDTDNRTEAGAPGSPARGPGQLSMLFVPFASSPLPQQPGALTSLPGRGTAFTGGQAVCWAPVLAGWLAGSCFLDVLFWSWGVGGTGRKSGRGLCCPDSFPRFKSNIFPCLLFLPPLTSQKSPWHHRPLPPAAWKSQKVGLFFAFALG